MTRAEKDIRSEADRATALYGDFAGPHELESVLREELEEYAEHVRKKHSARPNMRMRQELVQIAAVAMRAVEQMDDELGREISSLQFRNARLLKKLRGGCLDYPDIATKVIAENREVIGELLARKRASRGTL